MKDNQAHPRMTMADLVDYVMGARAAGNKRPVILAFCFSDELALKACLEGCREAKSIPVIMVTMNQVNSDGGYTGLTAGQFVGQVNRLADEAGYDGPIIFGRDHGGPFIIEAHKQWSRAEEMAWVKQNITKDLDAGFTCWHADGTSGRDDELENGRLPVSVIADTTLDLIRFCEQKRERLGLAPIAYEVGSEEQQGGLTAPEAFDDYLSLMKNGIREKELKNARIDFVVAQTGTHMKLRYEKTFKAFDLVQAGFQPRRVKILDKIAEKYRSANLKLLFTQHYSDHITPDDAAALRRFGAGKANFGPEMTMPELKLLLEWETAEREALRKQGKTSTASRFRETMLKHLDRRPDFWLKFIPPHTDSHGSSKTPSIFEFSSQVQDALIVFRGRYVKSRPQCRTAVEKLFENVVALGIDPHPAQTITAQIKTRIIIPRIEQFQMTDLPYEV